MNDEKQANDLPATEETTLSTKQITGEAYNERDQELIHQLMESRLSQKEELEYDPLEDYEVPPRTQFSMLAKPAVTIKKNQLSFNMACIRLFSGIMHVLPILSRKRRRLSLIPLADEEPSSVQWARQKDDKWVNRPITSNEFLDNIFAIMHWNKSYRYKVLGHIANSPRGLILVFDLDEAITYTGTSHDVVDEKTGEIKQKKDVFFPKQYKNRIGIPYSDYVIGQQMSLFEDFEDIILPTRTYDEISDEDIIGEPQQISEAGIVIGESEGTNERQDGET